MENASKALIIAGAILLSILLISLGILIYSQAADTVNNSGMDEAAKNAFNNKLLKYEGEKKKGTIVKNLYSEIQSINADQGNIAQNTTVTMIVHDNFTGTGASDRKFPPDSPTATDGLTSGDIVANGYYTITCEYTDGIIKTVTATRN